MIILSLSFKSISNYSQSTGSLFYNQNGNPLDSSSVFEFANLGNADITLSGNDFLVIG